MSDRHGNLPGLKWITLLGSASFLAGFVGPIVLVPNANLGLSVDIFITGPCDLALDALLWGLCALVKAAVRTQWLRLYSVVTLGVIATLQSIRREPAW